MVTKAHVQNQVYGHANQCCTAARALQDGRHSHLAVLKQICLEIKNISQLTLRAMSLCRKALHHTF